MKYSRWLAAILFWPSVALIAWGELTPHPPPETAVLWDKAEHFTAYFGLAGMVSVRLGMRRALLWAALGLVLLGGLLEVLQGFTGRDPDLFDEVANSIGVLCGIGAGWVYLRLLGPRRLVGETADE